MKTKMMKFLCIVCTAMLTVFCSKSDPDVKVTGVSLNKTVLNLTEGESETLTATLQPENATNVEVAWSSSDSTIASVDRTGTVTAVKVGEATITVTSLDGGKTATCAVTVMPIAVTGVSLDKTSLALALGESETLTATVEPSDATDKSVAWSSTDASVASVDNTGKVTALKAGSATIKVTTQDGAKTAECAVTVTDRELTASFDATFAQMLQTKGYIADAAKIMMSEIMKVTVLDVSGTSSAQGPLTSLKGLEFFLNLQELKASYNQLTAIDVSRNTKLSYLNVVSNQLTAIDVSKNTALRTLNVNENKISAIDVSNNTELVYLYASYNQLTTIDVSRNTKLKTIEMVSNKLTALDASANTALTYVSVSSNQLATIDVSHSIKLSYLNVGSNQLTSLYVGNNTALTYLYAEYNKLTSLDVSANTKMELLGCENNPGNADGKMVVTVWSGFTVPSKFPSAGKTWKVDGKTITLEYKEVA